MVRAAARERVRGFDRVEAAHLRVGRGDRPTRPKAATVSHCARLDTEEVAVEGEHRAGTRELVVNVQRLAREQTGALAAVVVVHRVVGVELGRGETSGRGALHAQHRGAVRGGSEDAEASAIPQATDELAKGLIELGEGLGAVGLVRLGHGRAVGAVGIVEVPNRGLGAHVRGAAAGGVL